jgi:hypothetical protein
VEPPILSLWATSTGFIYKAFRYVALGVFMKQYSLYQVVAKLTGGVLYYYAPLSKVSVRGCRDHSRHRQKPLGLHPIKRQVCGDDAARTNDSDAAPETPNKPRSRKCKCKTVFTPAPGYVSIVLTCAGGVPGANTPQRAAATVEHEASPANIAD